MPEHFIQMKEAMLRMLRYSDEFNGFAELDLESPSLLNHEELQRIWINYQKFEEEILDGKRTGRFGDYAVDAISIYYRIKQDMRTVLQERGILH